MQWRNHLFFFPYFGFTLMTVYILMFSDLISNIQGDYEGQWNNIFSLTLMTYEPDGMDGMYGYGVYISHNPNGNVFNSNTSDLYYDDYAKDW